jgi:hypothetical protein
VLQVHFIGMYKVQVKSWEVDICSNRPRWMELEDLAGEGIPPQDCSWEKRIFVELETCWDGLVFTFVVGSSTAWDHGYEVLGWIDGY